MKPSTDAIVGGFLGLVILCGIEYAGWMIMHSDGYTCYRGCGSLASKGFIILLVVNGGLLAALANVIIPMTPYGKKQEAKERARQDRMLEIERSRSLHRAARKSRRRTYKRKY